MSSWLDFLFLTFLCIFIQGLFALFEMACVSFNKMRLQYFVSLGRRRAIWLNQLIQSPFKLFGTTLICANAALQIGSECARRFYESIHLQPDWAPLTQLFLIMIFSELVPLFTARRHPEQLALALSPLMLLISRLLTPVIWVFEMLSKGLQLLIGKAQESSFVLSREELERSFEEGETTEKDFNTLVAKLFHLKQRTAREVMVPIPSQQLLPALATLSDARDVLLQRYAPYLFLYQRSSSNIVAIAYVRDLISLDPKKKVLDLAKPPWFVTEKTSLLQILEQFRRNNQTVAVILDAGGLALGMLTLDQILETLLGPELGAVPEAEVGIYVKRTVPGTYTVGQFNREFQANLAFEAHLTLSDLIVERLQHLPAKGESIEVGDYELTVLEPNLRGARIIAVKSLE